MEELIAKIASGEDVRASLIAIKSQIKEVQDAGILTSAKGYTPELLISLLDSDDAKTRKNALQIMALIRDKIFAEAVALHYESEETMFVKASYVETLRNIGFEGFEDILAKRLDKLERGEYDEADIKHISEELHILNSLGLTADKRDVKPVYSDPKCARTIVLMASRDMIPTLLTECSAIDGVAAVKRIFCGVAVNTDKYNKYRNIRIYKRMCFAMEGLPRFNKAQLAKALACGDFIDIMRESLISDTQSAYRFRISANEDIRQLAMEMEALSGGALVNSPSDYDAEIKLYRNKEGMYFPLLILPGMPDARFRYRKEYVAESMTPVNAACVVSLAKEYLARGAQVIDPFCGVGTLLIERSKAVKCGYMYGTDTFGDAIEGAKHNSAAAHVEVNYIHRDYFDFTTEYLFDELITDMPVISEGRADYIRRFLDKTATIMKSGGVCIIYGPYGGELVRAAKVRADYEQVRSFELNSKDGNSLQIIKYRG